MKHPAKQQQPQKRHTVDARLKLHLHLVSIGEITYRVCVPRPATIVRFSTNYFHDTWHIISDKGGAQLLARLLWGLSYQRQKNTLVFLSGEFVVPNPFDAEPSEPIILTSSHLTVLDGKKMAQLRHKMKMVDAPQNTVRCLTFGLDAALNYIEEAEKQHNQPHFNFCQAMTIYPWWNDYKDDDSREVMRRCGGCICYAAPPHVLRRQAFTTARLNPQRYEMDYHYLAEHWAKNHAADGEIQVFKNYQAMRRDAAVARREVGGQDEFANLESERLNVQNHALEVRRRRENAWRSTLKKRKK